jgi:hypothetical protein
MLLAGVLVLLAYLTSLAGSFQFDDFNVIVDNAVVHSMTAWWADVPRGNRPLLKLSYTLNWIGSSSAFGFHLVNLAIHLLNTALVYQLTRHVIAANNVRPSIDAGHAALIAALLFALHPAQTEAVTYISGRSASLMATFYIGAVLAHIIGTVQSRRLISHVVSPLLFALAVATKESAVTLPLLLLVWELSRTDHSRAVDLLRRLWPQALALAALAIVLVNHPVYASRIVPDFSPRALHDHLLTAVLAINHLIAQLLLPWPLAIDPDLRPATAWTTTLALQAGVLFTLIGFAIRAVRRRPWLGLGVAWFFVVLLPTNSVLPRLDIANDRQLYLAGVGMCMAIGIEIELLHASQAGWPRLVAVGAIGLFASLTAIRNLDYLSEVRLWEQTARVSHDKPRAFNNLGFAYSSAGCQAKAEAAYRKALSLDPNYLLARDNLTTLIDRDPAPSGTDC